MSKVKKKVLLRTTSQTKVVLDESHIELFSNSKLLLEQESWHRVRNTKLLQTIKLLFFPFQFKS
jgi:hypothetical protein